MFFHVFHDHVTLSHDFTTVQMGCWWNPTWIFALLRHSQINLHSLDTPELALQVDAIFVAYDVIWRQMTSFGLPSCIRHLGFYHFLKKWKKQQQPTGISLKSTQWIVKICEKFEKTLTGVKLPNPIKRNRVIEFDWVRLPNVRLPTPGRYPENAVSSYSVNRPKNAFHHDRMRCIFNINSNPEEYSSSWLSSQIQCIYLLQNTANNSWSEFNFLNIQSENSSQLRNWSPWLIYDTTQSLETITGGKHELTQRAWPRLTRDFMHISFLINCLVVYSLSRHCSHSTSFRLGIYIPRGVVAVLWTDCFMLRHPRREVVGTNDLARRIWRLYFAPITHNIPYR